MIRRLTATIFGLFLISFCQAQKPKDSLVIDTTFTDYDLLFSELDAFIDSLMEPRSFTLFNMAIGQSYLTYVSKTQTTAEAKQRITYSPSIGHYDKSGFGITVGASLVNDGTGLNPFQFSVSGSYDYQKSRSFITGISLTHFFTKPDLPFYTSPLQNEAYAYFSYRKLWFKPSIGLSYGWGSRDDLEEREERIQNIQLAQKGFTRISTKESIIDFNLITSVRHDFYFLNTFSKEDHIRITPQITFTSGTQQFGFNQTSNTFATLRGRNILYSTENIALDNHLYFQPVSLTTYLKTEYAVGKFFIQPQLMVDYYFPAPSDNFTTAFIINTGFLF